MKILIFGGTTEGRLLASQLVDEGQDVTVSCATPLGIEELRDVGCRRLCGRLDAQEIEALSREFDLVVDATHPYATLISANIRSACEASGARVLRVLRQPGAHPDCVSVRSSAEAAAVLLETEGNILLAIGSKELSVFAPLPPERLFARILPAHMGIDACEAIGIPHRNIIAMQGPFSQELNEAILRQCDIRYMVTKNSGAAGGFAEKIAAAEALGVTVILVEPPEDHGVTMEELLERVREACR